MEEVLPQDIISGKYYYVEYWGRVNDQGRTDSTQSPVLLHLFSFKTPFYLFCFILFHFSKILFFNSFASFVK